ncbi:MAG: SLBB domain-containing protein [Blastocatellia bacterium]
MPSIASSHFLVSFFIQAFPVYLFVFVFVSSVFAQTELIPAPKPTQPSDLIHLGDLIDVDVVGSFEFDWRGSLTPEGFLEGYDRIEQQIFGLCRREEDVAQAITVQLSKVLREPKVTVKILDRSNRAVAFLTGAIRFPQRFQIKRKVQLNEILIIAGGLSENSSGEVRIIRPQNLSCRSAENANAESNGPRIIDIKISDLLRGDPSANPRIESGDIIDVFEAFPIYVIGGVNSPGRISSRSQITLSRAIASVGGLAKNGVSGGISIFRREAGKTEIITANLDKINAKTEEDPVLKAYDIIDVEEKGRGKRKYPPELENERRLYQGAPNKLPLRVIE